MPEKRIFPRKFLSNNIKFLLDKRVGEARDESVRKDLIDRMCVETDSHQRKISRVLNNNAKPTIDLLVVAAQLLEVPIEELITLESAQ